MLGGPHDITVHHWTLNQLKLKQQHKSFFSDCPIWFPISVYNFKAINQNELRNSFWLQDWESFVGGWSSPELNRSHPTSSTAVREAVRKWAELQAGQRILVTTPSVVVGYRCQVYRSEGATQWYTAVIVGHDEETGVCQLTHRHVRFDTWFSFFLSLSFVPFANFFDVTSTGVNLDGRYRLRGTLRGSSITSD